MKVSLIFTVLNEGGNVQNLLDSIMKQSRKPNEIVAVDGGSRDNTIEVLKRYKKRLPIRIILARGANIAQGRNIAIDHAKYPIIVSTDGGTTHDRNWLKNIVKNIEDGYDVSAGLFFPLPQTKFEEIVGKLFYPNMKKVPDDWPPSSRSAAFTKKAWKKSGGYPEELYTAEDSIFNYRLKAIGARYKTTRNAKSYWRPRPTFWKFFKQYFTYAKGNGESLLALYKYPENRMLYAFWLLVMASVISYIYSIPALIGIWIAFIFAPLLRSFKALGVSKAGLVGWALMISALKANVLGTHYGLLRRALGLVKAPKISVIREVG